MYKKNDFNDFLTMQLKQVRNTLTRKEAEYAIDEDRMHNFNTAAKLMRTTPEIALLGMMVKHIISVVDLLKNPGGKSNEFIDEKFIDLINYSLLGSFIMQSREKPKDVEYLGGIPMSAYEDEEYK